MGNKSNFLKKTAQCILIISLLALAITGCKIERPEDVAREMLNDKLLAYEEMGEDSVTHNTYSEDEKYAINDDDAKSEKDVDKSNATNDNNSKSDKDTDKSDTKNVTGKTISVDDLNDKDTTKDLSKYDMHESGSNSNGNTNGNGNSSGNGNSGGNDQEWDHYDDSNGFDFEDKDGDGRDDATGLDQYLTDPIPDGKPHPVEPGDVNIDANNVKTCTLSIRMDTILDNVGDLDDELKYMLEKDGIKDGVIYAKREVVFYEGESVFDVLLRETKAYGIHMEFSFTPMYNSHYIEGINNFYEFSCGELSGWMYKVNGWYPNYGCSRYKIQQGDEIAWNYTCDLGRDLPGGEWLGGTK